MTTPHVVVTGTPLRPEDAQDLAALESLFQLLRKHGVQTFERGTLRVALGPAPLTEFAFPFSPPSPPGDGAHLPEAVSVRPPADVREGLLALRPDDPLFDAVTPATDGPAGTPSSSTE